jgi:Flp pilus assembly protein TadD
MKKAFLIFCLIITSSCASSQQGNKIKKINEALSPYILSEARTAEKQNKYEKAANNYLILLESDKKSDEFLLGASRNLRYIGKEEQALKLISSTKTKPYSKKILIEYGKLNIANNEIDEALNALKTALEKDDKDIDVLNAIAIAYDEKEDFTNSQEYYKKALKLSPRNPEITNNLSLSLAKSGKIKEAIKLLEKMVYSSKSSPLLRQNLALLKTLVGDHKEAEELMKKDLDEKEIEHNKKLYKKLNLL